MKNPSQNKDVQQLIDDIEAYHPDRIELFMLLRDTAFLLHPQTKEKVMYGGIMFSLANDYGGIFSYKNHISFEFTAGANFDDPGKLLEGKGKFRRHLKFRSIEDIENKNLSYYLKQLL